MMRTYFPRNHFLKKVCFFSIIKTGWKNDQKSGKLPDYIRWTEIYPDGDIQWIDKKEACLNHSKSFSVWIDCYNKRSIDLKCCCTKFTLTTNGVLHESQNARSAGLFWKTSYATSKVEVKKFHLDQTNILCGKKTHPNLQLEKIELKAQLTDLSLPYSLSFVDNLELLSSLTFASEWNHYNIPFMFHVYWLFTWHFGRLDECSAIASDFVGSCLF